MEKIEIVKVYKGKSYKRVLNTTNEFCCDLCAFSDICMSNTFDNDTFVCDVNFSFYDGDYDECYWEELK